MPSGRLVKYKRGASRGRSGNGHFGPNGNTIVCQPCAQVDNDELAAETGKAHGCVQFSCSCDSNNDGDVQVEDASDDEEEEFKDDDEIEQMAIGEWQDRHGNLIMFNVEEEEAAYLSEVESINSGEEKELNTDNENHNSTEDDSIDDIEDHDNSSHDMEGNSENENDNSTEEDNMSNNIGDDDDVSYDTEGNDDDNLPVLPFFTQDRESHGFRLAYNCCNNCRRMPNPDLVDHLRSHPYYAVKLKKIRMVKKEAMRRKFSNLKWPQVYEKMKEEQDALPIEQRTRVSSEGANLHLCDLCQMYLKNGNVQNEMSIVWPAMIWQWLSNEKLIERYGSKLWSLVPIIWRPWWIEELKLYDFQVYGNITIETPLPVFKDVSISSGDFFKKLIKNSAKELRDGCNKHLYPIIKCPWGCTEYYHKAEGLDMDCVVARLMGTNVTTVSAPAKTKKILATLIGIREDFLDYCSLDDLLSNPNWEIRASIGFVGDNRRKEPVVLACRDHSNGSKGRYLHVPRSPCGVLPCKIQDQLTPAVVRTNTLKPLKAHGFSHTFQMHEMKGEYNGVDTIRVSEHHNFSEESKILSKNQSLAIQGRKDIKALVREWGDEGKIIPPYIAESMLQKAEMDFPDTDILDEYCHGATFVTLQDAVKLQILNKTDSGRVIKTMISTDDVSTNVRFTTRHYIPSWPKAIVHVHPYNSFGCSFPLLPKIISIDMDTRLAWYLIAIHTIIPTIWEASDELVKRSDDWTGFVLSYAAKECYPERYQCKGSTTNPFKIITTRSSGDNVFNLLVNLGMKEKPEMEEDTSGIGYSSDDESSDNSNNSSDNDDDDDDDNSDVNDSEDEDAMSPSQYIMTSSSDDDNSNSSEETSSSSNGSSTSGNTTNVDVDTINMTLDDDVSIEQIHTDGQYHPTDLDIFFSKHTQIMTLPLYDGSNVKNVISTFADETHTAVLFYRMHSNILLSEDDAILPNNIVDTCNAEWELRFVASSGGDQTLEGDKDVYCRHGGKSFPGWWHQHVPIGPRKPISQEQVSGNIPKEFFETWEVAVYVKQKTLTLDMIRDSFLQSMGKHAYARCGEHDIPLVVSPFGSLKKCCLSCKDNNSIQCPKNVAFQCPVNGCMAAMCTNHHKEKCKDIGQFPYTIYPTYSSDTESIITNENNVSPVEENNSLQHCNIDINSEELTETIVHDECQIANNDSDDSDDSDCSIDQVDHSSILKLGVLESVPIPEMSPYIPMDIENDDMWGFGADDIPMTNNFNEPIKVYGDPTSMSGCTILNNMGTLLARKNKKLIGSKNQQFLLQKIVSTTPGNSVPLVYAEGMLFPSLLWKDSGVDGSILGSIPTGLLSHDSTLRKHGIASIQEHIRARIKNTSLRTSTDVGYICYAFDNIVNLGCRHEDTRVILHRGITGCDEGIRINGNDKQIFDTDSTDSRATVNKLASAVGEKQATYFFTHTANQQMHFGLQNIKEWIDGDEVMQILCPDPNTTIAELQEVRKALLQQASVIMLRNWMEVSLLYMNYITHSKEKPLGEVEHIWWRYEFQDSVGNLPHIHALIWLHPGSTSVQEKVEDRIRGSSMTIIRYDEIDKLVSEGLLSCKDEALEVNELALRVLKHVCNSRCKRRVGPGNDDLRCRATNNSTESKNARIHTTETIHVQHSVEAENVLEEIGLFSFNPNTGCKEPTVDALKATKHYPPADYADGTFSACNGRLFTLTRSNGNLKIVTGYLASRYLAKYLALVDEHNRVYIGAMSKENNALKMDFQFLHNTKITGSKIQEQKKADKRRDSRHPSGRAISHMEILCVLLGYNQVHTTLKFVHVPTCPFEERPAFDRKIPFQKLQEEGKLDPQIDIPKKPEDLDPGSVIPTYLIRNVQLGSELPLWRQIGDMESVTLRDQCLSPHTLDAITIFSIRPPELRFIRQPKYYFQWFYRDTSRSKLTFTKALSQAQNCIWDTLECSCWLDGSDCRVYVRPAAISLVLNYLQHGWINHGQRPDFSFYPTEIEHIPIPQNETPFQDTLSLFEKLNKGPPRRASITMYEEWQIMVNNLIVGDKISHQNNKDIPIVWYNSIKPTQPGRWLIHILISMGEFDCEMNLFGCGTMLDCFIRAKLMGINSQTHRSDINNLVKRYITEQLVFLPGGARQFDRHVVACQYTLIKILLEGQLPLNEMPSALFTQAVQITEKKSKKFVDGSRKTLIEMTYKEISRIKIVNNLPPDSSSFINATRNQPYNWKPHLQKGATQSDESFVEQQNLLDHIESQLDTYEMASAQQQTKNLTIVGGPGVGKTTIMQLGVLQCISYGLFAALTSQMCERSKILGGRHIAILLSIPVNEKASTCRLAEMAIASLLRQPDRIALICCIDVLFLDEMGQVSAELIAIMDIIFRRIRGSTAFMGGILIITTMDEVQLHPVHGRPPLLSPHMLTSFKFYKLSHSIRASTDIHLRTVMDISRLPPEDLLKPEDTRLATFSKLIEENCTWVSSWNDPIVANASIVRIFGKKAAVWKSQESVMSAMKKLHGQHMLFSTAHDFESSVEGNWVPATIQTSKELSKKIKLPHKLAFYPNAIYEMTFNKEGHFSQGQLAVLPTMPLPAIINRMEPITVYVAPDGEKSLHPDLITNPTPENFIHHKYRPVQIGTAPERPEQIGFGLQAKRQQYGLRHRIACTIHAGMGLTLQQIISKLSLIEEDYMIWEKEQAVVLLSRTHDLKSIIFVGSKADTINALKAAILRKSQYSEYMRYILGRLTCNNDIPFTVDILLKHPWRPVDVPLPCDNSGYAYILVSLSNKNVTYIGQTSNLAARYVKHANGKAAMTTANPLYRPWALMAYVSGFESCPQSARQAFERLWQVQRDQQQHRNGRPLTPNEIANVAKSLIEKQFYKSILSLQDKTLVYVQCGYLH